MDPLVTLAATACVVATSVTISYIAAYKTTYLYWVIDRRFTPAKYIPRTMPVWARAWGFIWLVAVSAALTGSAFLLSALARVLENERPAAVIICPATYLLLLFIWAVTMADAARAFKGKKHWSFFGHDKEFSD